MRSSIVSVADCYSIASIAFSFPSRVTFVPKCGDFTAEIWQLVG
jgi:hypothetical protein